LYQNAKINNLTEKEMKTYSKSIMDYDDVILVADHAKEEGIAIGEKRAIEKFIRNGCMQNMSIKQISEITGLSEEQVFIISTDEKIKRTYNKNIMTCNKTLPVANTEKTK
jgi:predicted transposase/invertase (TIGR01784 family)